MSTSENINFRAEKETRTTFNLIDYINVRIKKEEENAIGITVILIMIGTMLASITAALSIHKEINYIALIFACVSAMGANAIAISQQAFKILIWAFIINIIGNILMIFFQLADLIWFYS